MRGKHIIQSNGIENANSFARLTRGPLRLGEIGKTLNSRKQPVEMSLYGSLCGVTLTRRRKKRKSACRGDEFTWNYRHILCPRCARKVASKGALVPLKRSAKVRARLIHQVMGDPRRRALSWRILRASTENEFTLRITDRRPGRSEIAGHSLSQVENSRRNIMGTQASESAKKKSFHFDRGETGCCPKFKLRLQVRHAIRRAITLSLLSNFPTKLNRRLVYWPWRPWRAHFITACNT